MVIQLIQVGLLAMIAFLLLAILRRLRGLDHSISPSGPSNYRDSLHPVFSPAELAFSQAEVERAEQVWAREAHELAAQRGGVPHLSEDDFEKLTLPAMFYYSALLEHRLRIESNIAVLNGSKTLAQIEEEVKKRRKRVPHESTDMARAFYHLQPKHRSQVAGV